MKVTFNSDYTLSYDGVNSRSYKKGETYEATHPHEARVFNALVEKGDADVFAEEKSPKPSEPKATKVTKPKATKKAD